MKRKKSVQRRNFLPALILTFLFWIGLIYLIFFQEPEGLLPIFIFYLLALVTFFFTFSLLFGSSRRGFLLALGIVLFLLLKQHQQANILSLILLFSLLFSIEVYFWKK